MNILFIALLIALSHGLGKPTLVARPAPELQPAEADAMATAAKIVAFDLIGLHSIVIDDVDDYYRIKLGDVYDHDQIRLFSRELREQLGRRGYLGAKVGVPVLTKVDGGVRVELSVTEGGRFRVGTVTIQGSTTYSPEELTAILGFHRGDLCTLTGLESGIDKIKELCTSNGHPHANVESDWVLHEAREGASEGIVDLDLLVEEGRQYVMGEISFVGLNTLDSNALCAKVSPREGELFDYRKLDRSLSAVAREYVGNADYYADYQVAFDNHTNRASVVVLGFKKWEQRAP